MHDNLLEVALTLSAYQWGANSNAVRNITNAAAFVLPVQAAVVQTPNRTLVRTVATCSMSFSMSPQSIETIASNVAEGLSCRASVWSKLGAGLPSLAQVSPYQGMATSGLILGWSELVCGAVVQGGDGSFTLKYGFPEGLLDLRVFRKITANLQVGICVAVEDEFGNWPSVSLDPIYSWTATVGVRILTALNT